MIGVHTFSHPYLTKPTRGRATAQWGQARTRLGRWLGQTPGVGRPPYGAFDRAVEVAAARGGLTARAGRCATQAGDPTETLDGQPASAGPLRPVHRDPR